LIGPRLFFQNDPPEPTLFNLNFCLQKSIVPSNYTSSLDSSTPTTIDTATMEGFGLPMSFGKKTKAAPVNMTAKVETTKRAEVSGHLDTPVAMVIGASTYAHTLTGLRL
jgi:hypothetical protein